MRIQLLCDQKWRDLPNLTVLKLQLERLGHRVIVSSTKDAFAMIKVFRPDCVVLNHLFASSNVNLAKALQDSAVAVIVLPTEGAVRPELISLGEGEFSDYRVFDRHLAWSEPAAEGIRKRWNLDETTVPVIGFTRLDFYTPGFSAAITPREEFCKRHQFDPRRPIVTWATAYNFADLSSEPQRLTQFMREADDSGVAPCYRRIGVSPELLMQIHSQERDDATSAFMSLVAARPDVQFVLRPHPAESRSFYEGMIANANLRNIAFCPQDYIWNILNASDLHLHRHCTTAVEAWMWDKPTIEMALTPTSPFVWPDREFGSESATDAPQLRTLVDRYLSGEKVDEQRRRYRREYIHKWFGPADGRRCAAAAESIDNLLAMRGRRRSYWQPFGALPASPRQTAAAAARYLLGKRPNEPLFKSVEVAKIDPYDKYIRLTDVRNYKPLVASAAVVSSRT